ncbi:DnaJ C-terminal domain-containing protein [Angustibacter sp. McL0619]|uniref:DnaJ C-terminal domain-containing protein n=1 Tax=Angustibacter sp. McL0619 TaxID=3415676 RepID=UPI003CEC70E4
MAGGQDWFEKDFYATLGVAKDADAAAIKKAYRKLARQYHPDANDGDDTRFKEIGEAYSVLSDPEQRQQYDAIRTMSHGGARFAPGGAGGPGFEDLLGGLFGGAGPTGQRASFDSSGIDLEELLRGMGAGPGMGGAPGGRGGRSFSGFGTRGPRRGADVKATTTLPFRDAVIGSTVTLGTPQGRTVTARIPAGVKDGQTIRLRGKGSDGDPGAPAGDLLIQVSVSADPVFGRQGDDLTVTVPVTFAEAALGAQIDVPTMGQDGAVSTVRVKVPAGTPSGRTLRVKGRGVQRSGTPGDLRVTVQVAVPQRLTDDARAAVEAYAGATAAEDPRADLMAKVRAGGTGA